MANEFKMKEIEERCRAFIKNIFDNYSNAHKITKHLEIEFEKKGLMCGFNWIPNHEYHGEIRVVFIKINDKYKGKLVTSKRLRTPLTRTMNLPEFIFNCYNPEGIYLLEKIGFKLGG